MGECKGGGQVRGLPLQEVVGGRELEGGQIGVEVNSCRAELVETIMVFEAAGRALDGTFCGQPDIQNFTGDIWRIRILNPRTKRP